MEIEFPYFVKIGFYKPLAVERLLHLLLVEFSYLFQLSRFVVRLNTVFYQQSLTVANDSLIFVLKHLPIERIQEPLGKFI